jgi:hypothetical protein
MTLLTERRHIPLTTLLLAILATVLLLLLPPEERLGSIIRSVFVHGALVQVALFTFAAAGVAGLIYLIRRSEVVFQWCTALQKTALVLWAVNAVVSAIPTYQAWGVFIAWDEPRTRATAAVVGVSVVIYLASRWVNDRTFTAIFNVVMAVVAWLLIKGATIVIHPFDPIGTSASVTYKAFFAGLLLLVGLVAVQMVRWFHHPPQRGPSV